jgi:hypothetical protein
MAAGCASLMFLMRERPQFVGQPTHGAKALLVQESPRLVARRTTDDISVIKPLQPDLSEVDLIMRGRRDYRGLKTISDMSGEVRARYTVTNFHEEPIFVLFTAPHPRAAPGDSTGLLVSGLRLTASSGGVQENGSNSWLWSGILAAHAAVWIEISYQVSSLQGVTYQIADRSGNPARHVRVRLERRDLDSTRLETADGLLSSPGGNVVWERRDFLTPDYFSATIIEGRNLYTSLLQLLEMGPVISLLFLLAASAVILVRQPVSVIQIMTISAGYALYFPLILYLSSRFSFAAALAIAVLAPGILLLNYARWLLGVRIGVIGGGLFLILYQIFPTLAAFSGWNRGMVLLCLGVVTLWVLIQLQNQGLKHPANGLFVAGLAAAFLALPGRARAGEVQLLIPGPLAADWINSRPAVQPLISFQPAQYQVRQKPAHFEVDARVLFRIVRPGDAPSPLFSLPVHLQQSELGAAGSTFARLVVVTNRIGLYAAEVGDGELHLRYRVPVERREGRERAEIPMLLGVPGTVWLEALGSDLDLAAANRWSSERSETGTRHEIGVAGEDRLVLDWRDHTTEAGPGDGRPVDQGFYGIGLSQAQHLTVINSDGSCTHFAEFELPAFQTEEFRLRLPAGARLISVSLNGVEVEAPPIDDRWCRLRLDPRQAQQTAHRLSFRLAYPLTPLGFLGSAELTLPEVALTAGSVEWVVALPTGFEARVVASGMEAQRSTPDLGRFGEYGRVLKSHPQLYLTKNLAPPGIIGLNLSYRQRVPGLLDAGSE